MSFCVYTLRRPDGTPFYVGKGLPRRPRKHLADWGGGKNPFKSRVIAKIRKQGGEPSIKIERRFKKESNAHAYEMKLIKLLGRHPNGPLTNLTDGGEGTAGYRHTDVAKANMSKSRQGQKLSPGHAASFTKAGQAARRGQKISLRHRAAISRANKGKEFSDQHLKNLSVAMRGNRNGEANKGRHCSAATKAKISAACKLAPKRANYKHTEATKEKLRAAWKRRKARMK